VDEKGGPLWAKKRVFDSTDGPAGRWARDPGFGAAWRTPLAQRRDRPHSRRPGLGFRCWRLWWRCRSA